MYKNEYLRHNIRRLRKERGLTQRELANALDGRQAKVIVEWESGRAGPRVSTLLEMANFFDVALDEFFKPTEV